MHEIGYCESLLPVVERRAEGRPVAKVGVRAGAMHRLVPDVFQQAFELVAAGTVADGAVTELVTVPILVECSDCGTTAETSDALATCADCGSHSVKHSGGDEFILEWLEYAPHHPSAP